MDELWVRSEVKRNTAVVMISGRVDSVTAAALDEQLSKIAHENNRLVFDLSGVTYLSSAGVRAVVKTMQSAEKSGGGVVLANVSEVVGKVLETVGMTQMLRLFPSVEEAVASFRE